MSVPLLVVAAAAATVALAGCDIAQQRPETTAVRAGSAGAAHPHEYVLVPGRAQPDTGNTATENDAGGERSIRLYGPGVTRARQTRV